MIRQLDEIDDIVRRGAFVNHSECGFVHAGIGQRERNSKISRDLHEIAAQNGGVYLVELYPGS